ncbi:hypothetical protein H072_4761 [Dactylellina haptotyla CBS 200.50]|uniref:pH-response regulator protein palC n=1 Tax=Dactylellina haptotyla (strain CBS 200.50) TaxID=1284197 RepID=S8BPJ2_DACHA|nr:hypothetical protein H072_4761 [Dactylellina haptotyla CBS 200.50]
MTFAFALPTTSPVSFGASFTSSSAPSLPSAATTRRSVFRDSLKRHKRLSPSEQTNAISSIQATIDEYLPYLHTLDAYITSQDVTQIAEFETEWRATLSRRNGPAEPPRVRCKGLDYEISFATATLAYAHSLRARSFIAAALQSPPADSSSTSSSEHMITQATQHMNTAASIFLYLQNRSTTRERSAQSLPADVTTSMYNALWSLSLASATLLAVLKQDPYPSIIAIQYDKTSKEWMYKAPTVPSGVKALLLARLCMYAADMAGKAAAGVASASSSGSELRKYCDDLAKTAKAKACRFLGVDAEVSGKLGEAIGWVVAGKEILGLVVGGDEEKGKLSRGLDKFKKAREERKIEKTQPEGLLAQDAGKMEEAMVLNELEKKWRKINDNVNFDKIKPTASLIAMLPSGRPIFPENQTWTPPKLSSSELVQLQNQAPNDGETDWLRADDSDDDLRPVAESSVQGGFPRSQSTGYY